MGLTKTKLTPAIEASHEIRHTVGEHWGNGLGWQIDAPRQLTWHGGATGGYSSIVVVDTTNKRGVVVLTNMVSKSVDAIGFLSMVILRGQELPPVRPRRPAKIDREILAQYVGDYEVSPSVHFTITLEQDRLLAQRNDETVFRIYPSSELEFYNRYDAIRMTFEEDETGNVVRLVLHTPDGDVPANRLPAKGKDKEKEED
jgi:CubicO group peptidase (beta-lactamase class C family)